MNRRVRFDDDDEPFNDEFVKATGTDNPQVEKTPVEDQYHPAYVWAVRNTEHEVHEYREREESNASAVDTEHEHEGEDGGIRVPRTPFSAHAEYILRRIRNEGLRRAGKNVSLEAWGFITQIVAIIYDYEKDIEAKEKQEKEQGLYAYKDKVSNATFNTY